MPPRKSPRSPGLARQAGFTLVEVLVVLMIVALTSGVLFQALERAYRLQNRFGAELFKVQHGQMASDWYRQSIQGLYPDQPDGRHLFQGDEHEFSGLSSNPLGDDYGAPTPISWKISVNPQNGNTELSYAQENHDTAILSWRAGAARFIYLDDQRNPHERWPPPLGLFPQLPRQIQLQAKDAGEPISLVASPMGPSQAILRPQDIFGATPSRSPATPAQRPQAPTGFIP